MGVFLIFLPPPDEQYAPPIPPGIHVGGSETRAVTIAWMRDEPAKIESFGGITDHGACRTAFECACTARAVVCKRGLANSHVPDAVAVMRDPGGPVRFSLRTTHPKRQGGLVSAPCHSAPSSRISNPRARHGFFHAPSELPVGVVFDGSIQGSSFCCRSG